MTETKTINLRGVPAELVGHLKAAAAIRGLTMKAFILGVLEEVIKAGNWNYRSDAALPRKRRGSRGSIPSGASPSPEGTGEDMLHQPPEPVTNPVSAATQFIDLTVSRKTGHELGHKCTECDRLRKMIRESKPAGRTK